MRRPLGPRRWWLVTGALAAALSLAASGCGKKGSPVPPSPRPTAAPPSEEPPPAAKPPEKEVEEKRRKQPLIPP